MIKFSNIGYINKAVGGVRHSIIYTIYTLLFSTFNLFEKWAKLISNKNWKYLTWAKDIAKG